MKKYERINQYLEQLRTEDEKIVFNMHWKDLVSVPQLKGIGKRSLNDILKEFKTKYGLMPEQESTEPKIDIVWNYLLGLYEDLGDEIHLVRGCEIIGIPELAGIGKTTICTCLQKFKKEHPQKTISPSKFKHQTTQKVCQNVADNLSKIGSALNLKQYQLADKIGASRSTMNLVCNVRKIPSLYFLQRLHSELGININTLLFNVGELFLDDEMSQEKGLKRRIVELSGEKERK